MQQQCAAAAAALLRAAAVAVREIDLRAATRLITALRRKRLDRATTLQVATLRAACELKRDRPHRAAAHLTAVLRSREGAAIVDDPVFLANLAVVFAHNGSHGRSLAALSCVPRSHDIWRCQGAVWQRDVAAALALAADARDEDADAVPRPDAATCARPWRDAEGEMIVHVKRELARCLRLLHRANATSQGAAGRVRAEQVSTAAAALSALRDECGAPQWGKSTAVGQQRRRVEAALARACVFRGP